MQIWRDSKQTVLAVFTKSRTIPLKLPNYYQESQALEDYYVECQRIKGGH